MPNPKGLPCRATDCTREIDRPHNRRQHWAFAHPDQLQDLLQRESAGTLDVEMDQDLLDQAAIFLPTEVEPEVEEMNAQQFQEMMNRMAAIETALGLPTVFPMEQVTQVVRTEISAAMQLLTAQMTQAPAEEHHLCIDPDCANCKQTVAEVGEHTRAHTLNELAKVPGVVQALQFNSQQQVGQLTGD